MLFSTTAAQRKKNARPSRRPSTGAPGEGDRARAHPVLEGLETRTLLSASQLIADPSIVAIPNASATTIAGYSPSQIKTAYGFSSVTLSNGVAGTGSGQTIAIVDAYNDPDISGDLSTFDKEYGLANPSLKVVSETGSSSLPATNSGWDLEISLDVEWAHAIAPGANILLVEANSASLGDLLTAVNYARDASGVSVVSMSWGSSEFAGETTYDSYFTTPSGHENVTFVSASGDEGSWYGPEWPASSPNVLSVGGTTLNLANSSGAYGSESGWSDSTGGISEVEREPGYQEIAQDTGARTTPDVAYDANPSTGFAVYDSVAYEGIAGWWEVGGTSAGAPQWAGLVAIADQGRAVKGLGTLNGATQTLPELYSLYTSSQYGSSFHDETSGVTGMFAAGTGYDAVTGLGSPKAAYVISRLIGAASTVTVNASTSLAISAGASKAAARAIDIGGAPPLPPRVAAVTEITANPAVDVGATAPNAPVQGVFAVAPSVSAQSEVGVYARSVPLARGDSQSPQSVEPSSHEGEGVVMGTFPGLAVNFGTTLAVSSVEWEIAAATGVVSTGAGAEFVEGLLASDAAAMAQVANTLNVRLSDEDAMIWKDTLAFLGGAMLVGGCVAKERQSGRAPVRKGMNPRDLCVGEERLAPGAGK